MKNKQYQRMLASAKRAAKTRQRTLHDGVYIMHCYNEPKERSYWDDFGFYLGSQYVGVFWVHPRMEYSDEADRQSYDHTGNPPSHDWLSGGTPIYKRRGKSRKAAVMYEMAPQSADTRVYYDNLFRIQDELRQGDTITITPSISIKQTSWGRCVDICYPVELRNEKDIIAFANRLKQHLRREINIFDEVEGYTYTGADWRKENPTENE
jgi:hypothetical protein